MVVYRQIEFAGVGWRGRVAGLLAVVLGVALVLALIVLSLGVAIVLLPVIAVAILVGRWRWRKLVAEAARRDRPDRGRGPVLDLDYEVIEKPRGEDRSRRP
jgi:hypothetical protein